MTVESRRPGRAAFAPAGVCIVAVALLVCAGWAPRTQIISPEFALNLGLIRGTIEPDTPIDQGVLLGDVTVLEFPPAPADRLRVTMEIEAVRPRGLDLECPDGVVQRLALAPQVPATVACEWETPSDGAIRLTRTTGVGRVLVKSLRVESIGTRFGPDSWRWPLALLFPAWWLARATSARHIPLRTLGLLAVFVCALTLAPRIELLAALDGLWLPFFILQIGLSVAQRSHHWSVGVVTCAVLAKLVFALSGYEGGDTPFHVHQLNNFARGDFQTRSVAPGLKTPLPVPYPPGIYAVLSPFGGFADDARGCFVIGLALWAAELCSLLLVLAISKKAGLARSTAWTAAAMYAVIPKALW